MSDSSKKIDIMHYVSIGLLIIFALSAILLIVYQDELSQKEQTIMLVLVAFGIPALPILLC